MTTDGKRGMENNDFIAVGIMFVRSCWGMLFANDRLGLANQLAALLATREDEIARRLVTDEWLPAPFSIARASLVAQGATLLHVAGPDDDGSRAALEDAFRLLGPDLMEMNADNAANVQEGGRWDEKCQAWATLAGEAAGLLAGEAADGDSLA